MLSIPCLKQSTVSEVTLYQFNIAAKMYEVNVMQFSARLSTSSLNKIRESISSSFVDFPTRLVNAAFTSALTYTTNHRNFLEFDLTNNNVCLIQMVELNRNVLLDGSFFFKIFVFKNLAFVLPFSVCNLAKESERKIGKSREITFQHSTKNRGSTHTL